MDPKHAANPNTGIPRDMASKSTTRWIFVGGLIAAGIWYASAHGYLGSAGDKLNQASKGASKPPTGTATVDNAASPTAQAASEGKKTK